MSKAISLYSASKSGMVIGIAAIPVARLTRRLHLTMAFDGALSALQRGPGRSPGRKRIWTLLTLKYGLSYFCRSENSYDTAI